MSAGAARRRLFISYRRGDSKHFAEGLALRLRRGRRVRSVFLDRDTLRASEHFPDRLADAIRSSDTCLVLIGPSWAGPQGQSPRIMDEDDFVRREVALALDRRARGQMSVVPIVLAGGAMPNIAQLPRDLEPLVDLQAIVLDDGLLPAQVPAIARELGIQLPHDGLVYAMGRALIGAALGGVSLIVFGLLHHAATGGPVSESLTTSGSAALVVTWMVVSVGFPVLARLPAFGWD